MADTYSNDENVWEVWEWLDTEDEELLLIDGGQYVLFEELSSVVESEIRRIHSQEDEESTSPYEKFERGDYDSRLDNIIYNLPPNGIEAPDSFKLMRACNSELVYGLTAWRKGKNPEYL
jgi:hypothetical protein